MSWFSSMMGGGGGRRVDGAKARELVKAGAVLVDVRSPGEFAGGALPGARNIPVDQIGARVGELKGAKTVVVYCRSGGRSASAAGVLAQAGIEAYDLGPLTAW